MPLPFFLAALFGKAAASAAAKGVSAAGTAGSKGMVGKHAHSKLAQKVAKAVVRGITDSADAAPPKKRDEE